jgi:histidyl-tRNA synthetase
MKKPTALSGFPEWLPEQRIAEQKIIDTIRTKFESFGFAPIETRSVEPLEHLLKKGETDKEIYVLRRLQSTEHDENTNLGLHYDLTLPFARYVAQFRDQLQFPLKRYQIQKAWRGERPQEGRYREFLQADIDVVMERQLPIHFDGEIPMLLHEVLSSLPIPKVQILVNNRKILDGAYQAIGVSDVPTVLRIVDKLDKIGESAVAELLERQAALTSAQAQTCLALARIRTPNASFADAVRALGLRGDTLETGLNELVYVMESLRALPEGTVIADLRIARGFDYYTGTVYEGLMVGHEKLGAVCSGGRYDDLVEGGGTKLPGIGASIGVSRIVGRLFGQGLLTASRPTPTCVLITLPSEEARAEALLLAHSMRRRGINTELFHEPAKFDKQIRYAERKGIPYVLFFPSEGGGFEVRDLRTRVQAPIDANVWTPAESDRVPSLVSK